MPRGARIPPSARLPEIGLEVEPRIKGRPWSSEALKKVMGLPVREARPFLRQGRPGNPRKNRASRSSGGARPGTRGSGLRGAESRGEGLRGGDPGPPPQPVEALFPSRIAAALRDA